MPVESSLVLLHLSDLHFAVPPGSTSKEKPGHYWNSEESTERDLKEHDRKGLLVRLLEDPMLAKAKPGLVVVSGDLLDKADPSGIPLALDFLTGLAAKLSLPHGRFALVPGNHDVRREPGLGYRSFDQIYRTFYGTERPDFTGKPGHERADLFDYPEFGISIAGFNSSETLDSGNPQGSVGEFQRDAMRSQLDDVKAPRLRIALMHHHLEPPKGQVRPDLSVMNDPGSVRDWLLKNEFSLVLHGHQHVDWQTTLYERGWRLTVTAAGSLGVGNYGRDRWRLPLCYQLIIIRNYRQGLRLRREYSERECKWGQASAGADGRNAAHQELPLGPARGPSGQTRGDSRRFVEDFERLLKVTDDPLRHKLLPYLEDAKAGNWIDICALCRDLCNLLDQHYDKKRTRFASEARRVLGRVVMDVPTGPSPAAPPQVNLYSDEVEPVPVSTYLFMAILVAQAQEADLVDLRLELRDEEDFLNSRDSFSADSLRFSPTAEDLVTEFEKALWEATHPGRSRSYSAKCKCTLDECRQHRSLGDQREKCNEQQCCRYRLYAELDGLGQDGHRPYVVVDSENWSPWSPVAASMSSASFLRFGGGGLATGPVSEDELVRALKAFFKKADKH